MACTSLDCETPPRSNPRQVAGSFWHLTMCHESSCAFDAMPQSQSNMRFIASGVSKKSFELPDFLRSAQHDVSRRHLGFRRRRALIARWAF